MILAGCRAAAPDAEPTTPPPPTTLTTARALAQNGLTGWPTARLSTEPGRSWIVAVSPEHGPAPQVVLLSVQGEKLTQERGPAEPLFGGLAADFWPGAAQPTVALEKVPEEARLMVLTVSGSAGNDLERRRDAVAILRKTDGHVVWVGSGAWEDLEMGRCATGHTLAFSREKGALWLVHRGYAEWTDQIAETSQSPDYTRLKRDCRAPLERRTPLDLGRPASR